MASAFPVQVSAVQQTPNLVHQFYTDASTMIRYDGENNESASGMARDMKDNDDGIDIVCVSDMDNWKFIISLSALNFTEIEIKTAHSLKSWHGGVLVTVTGFVQAKDFICRRKFVETFFLAPQEKGLDSVQDPVSNYMIGEEIPPRDFISPPIPVEANNTVDEYNIPRSTKSSSCP
ncbi:hypothetical protein HPP92_008530 [Vanilla planifolia]|uniref:NTF2 domain-containing protein n=1 Tax=Vanilla planifolia TaxID=51239 RepID=A0A835V638_VANPL|nr:hypothetical protein HPP92_008530 [Vanilla planifolia]